MSTIFTRRSFVIGSSLLLPAVSLAPALAKSDKFDAQFAALEDKSGGRLGVFVLDTKTNETMAYRADERFAMCSTFKALAAAFVLARVDKGEESLDRHIKYTKADLLEYSPGLEKNIAKGMTVGQMCDAIVTLSDNGAANILLDSFGGPKALTAWLRSIGDDRTRLDRTEPELNIVNKGDERDTTTPEAMTRTLGRLLLGDVLKPASRDQFAEWLKANTTGDERLRAGVPSTWTVGDKTGTSGRGDAGDIGFLQPTADRTVLVSAYICESTKKTKELNPVFAGVARLVAGTIG